MKLTENKTIAILAQQIIDGSIEIIEGCRRIAFLKIYLIEDLDYRMIIGFVSQTDKFPIGSERKYYDEEYLKKLDKELNEYLVECRPTVLEACKNLINKYGS